MKNDEYVLVVGGSGDIGRSVIQTVSMKQINVLYTFNKSTSYVFPNTDNNIEQINVDVCNHKDIEMLVNYIIQNNYRLKGLVYNAGIIRDNLFDKMSEEDFLAVLNTNLVGCFRICKAVINNLLINGGNIVIISSISGLMGKIGQANYSASKAALVSLTRTLAMEYAMLKVRVNAVAPGLIDTKMTKSMSDNKMKELRKTIPLRRLGKPDEVAKTVYFLLSDDSSYITGQTVIVDGGILMR